MHMMQFGNARYIITSLDELVKQGYRENPNISVEYIFCVPCNRYAYATIMSKDDDNIRLCTLCDRSYK